MFAPYDVFLCSARLPTWCLASHSIPPPLTKKDSCAAPSCALVFGKSFYPAPPHEESLMCGPVLPTVSCFPSIKAKDEFAGLPLRQNSLVMVCRTKGLEQPHVFFKAYPTVIICLT